MTIKMVKMTAKRKVRKGSVEKMRELADAIVANPSDAAALAASTILLLLKLQAEAGVNIWPLRLLGADPENNAIVVSIELPFPISADSSGKRPTHQENPIAY